MNFASPSRKLEPQRTMMLDTLTPLKKWKCEVVVTQNKKLRYLRSALCWGDDVFGVDQVASTFEQSVDVQRAETWDIRDDGWITTDRRCFTVESRHCLKFGHRLLSCCCCFGKWYWKRKVLSIGWGILEKSYLLSAALATMASPIMIRAECILLFASWSSWLNKSLSCN